MTPQAQLLEAIGAASAGQNEALRVMVLCLDQLGSSAGLSELAANIFGWCRANLGSRRAEVIEVAPDFLVVLSRDNAYGFLGIVNDTKLRLLRQIYRLMPEFFGMVNQTRLVQVFDLPRDRRQLLERVKQRLTRSATDPAAPGLERSLTPDHIYEIEAAHERLGPERFADLFLRNQRIALIAHDRPPQVVMTEYFISIESIGRHILAGVNLCKDEGLFNRLTLTLDRLVLRTMRQLQVPLRYCSLNLNVQTVFSSEFEHLDTSLNRSLQHLTVEFRAGDIVQNFDQFIVARNLITSRGGTVAVDGIVPPMVGVLAASQIGARIAKVFWRPDAAADLRDRQAELQKWHRDGTMVVLARLDEEEAIDVGRQLGIGLFQGFHVDKLLRSTAARESFKVD